MNYKFSISLIYNIILICWYNLINKKESIGDVLINIFVLLGPSGIKIGQVLSHRIDIFPKEICKSLSKLTNNVIYLEKEEEKKLLEYCKSIINYDNIPERIGGGCIAITYKCIVNNRTLLFKIKRPSINSDLKKSFYILNVFIYIISIFNVVDYYDKFNNIKKDILNQANFVLEINELEYFRSKYINSENVIIPRVYRELSNDNIITQDYLDGRQLEELDILEKEKFAKLLWNFSFESAFINGHWHSDLHKGNIIFFENKIGIIDFGLTGKLNPFEKSVMLNYNTHILKHEWKLASNIYVSKMVHKKERLSSKSMEMFKNEIELILKNNFTKNKPEILGIVNKLAKCSHKYKAIFNNKFVNFELAFCTLSSTLCEMGYPNSYNFMRDAVIK
tara:strand:- start:695 stop:1867 length:1173 start_codon:yes stop_codon:yes gene_type:complete